ncbi:MAG TPA: helix-hairpin-helix domain-containing protein [Anaerolineae bacterium]|nr:helix-hairpin-helix domain-containing protein [Anaerolineae bacterium]
MYNNIYMQKRKWAIGKDNIEDLFLFLREKAEDSGLAIGSKQTLAIAVLIILAIAGGITLYVMSQPKPVIVSKAGESAKEGSSEDRPATKAKDVKMLFVHVAGAVVHPGVYHLKEGSRVIDAITAAGGGLQGSDQDALNLAAKVFDGQRVYVPKKGEVPPQIDGLSSATDPPLESGGKVNINTATMEQLDSLPGVGPVTAQKIIDYRSKHGPLKRLEELKAIDGIGSKKYDQIKDKACVE